jgi:hypothetical protein
VDLDVGAVLGPDLDIRHAGDSFGRRGGWAERKELRRTRTYG